MFEKNVLDEFTKLLTTVLLDVDNGICTLLTNQLWPFLNFIFNDCDLFVGVGLS